MIEHSAPKDMGSSLSNLLVAALLHDLRSTWTKRTGIIIIYWFKYPWWGDTTLNSTVEEK